MEEEVNVSQASMEVDINNVVAEENVSFDNQHIQVAEEIVISLSTVEEPDISLSTVVEPAFSQKTEEEAEHEQKPLETEEEKPVLEEPQYQEYEHVVEETTSKSKRQLGYTFTPLELPPCKVCNGKASGIHYGVNSCEACKGFFRRYLQRKEPYKCMKEGQCEITDRRRGNCSACRMQKCVMVGMSRDAVRQGRYTLTERTRTIMEVREIHERNMLSAGLDILAEAATSQSLAYGCDSPNNSETNNNDHRETGIACQTLTDVVAGTSEITENKPSCGNEITNLMFLNKSTIPQKDIPTPASDSVPSIDKIDLLGCGNRFKSLFNANIDIPRQCWPHVLSNLVSAMTNLTPLQTKSKEEIQSILKEGQKKYELQKQLFGSLATLSDEEHAAIFEATGLDIDNRNKFFEDHNKTMTTLILGFIDFAKVIPGFMDLPVSDQAALLKESRFEFFMISSHEAFDPNTEIMMTYKGDTYHMTQFCGFLNNSNFKNWMEFTRKIKHFDFTQMEKALVLGITLTFRDRANLENPDKVEEIQLWLIEQLMTCFRLHHGKRYQEYFRKLIDMFIEFRNITEEFLQTHKKWKNDPLMRSRIPALGFFLFEDD